MGGNNREYAADAAEQRTIGLRQNHAHTGIQANAQARAYQWKRPVRWDAGADTFPLDDHQLVR